MDWIKCSERMPEMDQQVLGWCACPNSFHVGMPFHCHVLVRCPAQVFANNTTGYEWQTSGPVSFFGQAITHWIPLPEPPKEAPHADR